MTAEERQTDEGERSGNRLGEFKEEMEKREKERRRLCERVKRVHV